MKPTFIYITLFAFLCGGNHLAAQIHTDAVSGATEVKKKTPKKKESDKEEKKKEKTGKKGEKKKPERKDSLSIAYPEQMPQAPFYAGPQAEESADYSSATEFSSNENLFQKEDSDPKSRIQIQKTRLTPELNVDNGVVSTADKSGFTIQTGTGDFLLKPYALIQAQGKMNYYDAEQLDASYQDHWANSGFAIPNAILGFSGRAFGRVTFNLAINAAQSGGALLQQAWFDIQFKRALSLRAGKFKTPFNQAYLVTLGETLFPQLPASLTTGVNVNKSLNAVNPSMATGFDLGVQLGGLFAKDKLAYQVGLFNGTGINVNSATRGQSDDWSIPSLLYAARIAYQPFGIMPTHQGRPDDLHNNKLLFALSGSLNVEAEDRSSNDWRAGAEMAWLINRFYFSAEGYMLHMDWTKRMQDANNLTFLGGYVQGGYFCTNTLQAIARWDFFDRNGTDKNGWLNMPAVGVNLFLPQYNVKLQGMYQFLGRNNHDSQTDRDTDDNGLPLHSVCVMLQYTF